MPSIWDEPGDEKRREHLRPRGLLDDAIQSEREAQRRRQQAESAKKQAIDDARAMQEQAIREFVDAMNRMGIAPRKYPCYVEVDPIINRKNGYRRTGHRIVGWHIGPWTKDELAGKVMHPKTGDGRYTVVTPEHTVFRNTRGWEWFGRFRGPVRLDLPCDLLRGNSHPDGPDYDYLVKEIKEALQSIVAGGRSRKYERWL
ncbi:MAG: hypothetical protein DIU75_008145 [Mycolicibacterium hassiacum]|jgi:hypothetical protein|uniref:hypothetical protein n=1 Tax=Mycolicibacterium hassiacum TaxID=46351 RepID=UPI0023F8BFCE|nr:hypothetical protein [Mycolicibacterium hassiacum]MBX5485294.1 hypothetical protein [Mycolicibacterium hassiacum]